MILDDELSILASGGDRNRIDGVAVDSEGFGTSDYGDVLVGGVDIEGTFSESGGHFASGGGGFGGDGVFVGHVGGGHTVDLDGILSDFHHLVFVAENRVIGVDGHYFPCRVVVPDGHGVPGDSQEFHFRVDYRAGSRVGAHVGKQPEDVVTFR